MSSWLQSQAAMSDIGTFFRLMPSLLAYASHNATVNREFGVEQRWAVNCATLALF